MTEEFIDADDMEDAIAEKRRQMFAENEHALKKATITFLGGPVDGETFDIPNGVSELAVETAFGPVVYERDTTSTLTFRPRTP